MQSRAKRWLTALLTVMLLISFTNLAEAKGNKGAKAAGSKSIKGKLVSVGDGTITVKEHHKHKKGGKAAAGAKKKAGKAKKAGKGKKKGVTLATTKKTKVTLNGAKSNVASLAAGMKVKVKEAGGTAKKIKAKTGKKGATTKPATATKKAAGTGKKKAAPAKKKGKGKK